MFLTKIALAKIPTHAPFLMKNNFSANIVRSSRKLYKISRKFYWKGKK